MVDGLYDMSDTCESARASCGLCKLACMDTLSFNFSFVSFRVLLLDAAVLARLILFLWRFMYDYNISMPLFASQWTLDAKFKVIQFPHELICKCEEYALGMWYRSNWK